MAGRKHDVNIVISLDSEGAVKGVRNLDREIEGVSGRAEKSFGGVQSALLGIGAVVGLRELKSQVTSLADESAYAQQSLQVLGDVAQSLGHDGQAAVQMAKDAGDALFNMFDYATALRNLLASGLELPKAVQLLDTLKNSAAANRKVSMSLADQIISTTEGIRNQNSVLTDNSGITKNVSTILLEYARSQGKTVAQLDRTTQAQAIANGFIEEGAVFLGRQPRIPLLHVAESVEDFGLRKKFLEINVVYIDRVLIIGFFSNEKMLKIAADNLLVMFDRR